MVSNIKSEKNVYIVNIQILLSLNEIAKPINIKGRYPQATISKNFVFVTSYL